MCVVIVEIESASASTAADHPRIRNRAEPEP
jgi:hypothetical protein